MWFERFYSAIKRIFGGEFITGNLDALASLDPSRIYVENVRSVFGVSHTAAVRFCETAVRQGIFERLIEVRCPDGSVPTSAPTEDKLPDTVPCYTHTDGFLEVVYLPTSELPKTVFYRLSDGDQSTETQPRTA